MGKRGPKPLSVEQLRVRGSRHTTARARTKVATKRPPRVPREKSWHAPTARELDKLIRELPGYDPRADSDGCWFDRNAARKVLEFFETKLRHVEGAAAGKLFLLERWEKAILANLFGWKTKDAQGRIVRRYRETLIYVPRKNGKTPLCAGICLYLLFEDGEAGAQIISAAAERNQATFLFRHARGMVARCRDLDNRANVFGGVGQRSIVLKDDVAASYMAVSADAYSKHGFNLHAAVVDELHAQPNRDMVDAFQTAMASENRSQPLLAHITTADFARPSICNEKHDYACKIRDRIIDDKAFLPVIFEALPTDDWTSPKVWAKANPNLGISVSLAYMERECKRAQETPTYENTFKRLHLNMKTEQDVRWLAMDRWDAGAVSDPVAWRVEALERCAGLPCFAGLDLSTTIDLTAFVLSFTDGENTLWLPYFWAPEENAKRRQDKDRVPYLTWAQQGFLKLTGGDVVDYDVVRSDIVELSRHFDIQQIAIDRWNAMQITTQLTGEGLNCLMFGQGFASMSSPSKELEALVMGRKLEHGGNPILRWMASNSAAETDAAGNIKPSKKKSTERIDGIVAGVMALGAAAGMSDGGGAAIAVWD